MTADLELQGLGETDALLKTSERPKRRALAVQLVALCGAAALAGAALASRAGANDVVVTGLARKGTDNRHVACPQMWEPVCGDDGKTYSNPCMAGAMSFTTGACQEAPPVTANETLPTNETMPTNESLPVDVPDRKFTTIPDRVPGCGCSLQTCCDRLAAGELYLGCKPLDAVHREICDDVTSGAIDGSMSVCDVPELNKGDAELVITIVDETCERVMSEDTCIPVRENASNWLSDAPWSPFHNGCVSWSPVRAEDVVISVVPGCIGQTSLWPDQPAMPFSIFEGGGIDNVRRGLDGRDDGAGAVTFTNFNNSESESTCPPPFGDFGPTGYIYPTDGSPGGVGRCENLPNGQSVVFTVTGEWPCAAPQTPEPTAAPTPHHHHHDGAVADFRDAALGSLVVAALTAAVLI